MAKAKNIKRTRPAPTGEQETLFDEPAAAVNPILKTQKEVATYYGVGLRQVGNWIAEIMPRTPEDNYDTREITPWLKEKGYAQWRANKPRQKGAAPPPPPPEGDHPFDEKPGIDGLHSRDYLERLKLKLETQKRELNLAIQRGQYLKREEVQSIMTKHVLRVKNTILGLPRAMAADLAGLEPYEIEQKLSAKFSEIMAEFSQSPFSPSEEEEEATTETTETTEKEEKEVFTTGDTGSTGKEEEV